jgi:hypothetical protein
MASSSVRRKRRQHQFSLDIGELWLSKCGRRPNRRFRIERFWKPA